MNKNVKWIRGGLYLMVSSMLFIAMWMMYLQAIDTSFSPSTIKSFEKKFQGFENAIDDELERLSEIDYNDTVHPFEQFKIIEKNSSPLRFAIYDTSDSLVFWNSNTVPFPLQYNDTTFNGFILHLQNGWYRAKVLEHKDFHFVGLCVIQYDYPYSNNDLENVIHPAFEMPSTASISFSEHDYEIESATGKVLFSIASGEEIEANKYLQFGIILILFLGFVLFFEAFMIFLNYTGMFGAIVSYFTPFILLALRYYSIKYQWLEFLTQLEIFQPSLFGVNMYFPSLGDLLINVLILFYGAIIFRKSFKPLPFDNNRSYGWLYTITGAIAHIMVYPFGWGIVYLFKEFIENSSINFNIDKLFTLSFYSIIGLLAMGFLLYTYYVYAQFTVRWLFRYIRNKINFSIVIIVSGFLLTWLLFDLENTTLLSKFWPLLVVVTCLYVTIFHHSKYNFGRTVFAIFICSIFTSQQISVNTAIREKKNRLLLAEKLATDEDPVTEIEFDVLEERLKRSDLFEKTFQNERSFSLSDFENEISKQFFNKFWDKYDISYYVYGTDSLPFGNRWRMSFKKFESYNEIIQVHGIQSQINKNIFFIPDYYDQISYLIKYPHYQNDTLKGFLFAELRSKKIPEQIGFPTLLLDKGTKIIEELHQYSFARYVNGNLITQIGQYSYPLEIPIHVSSNDSSMYFDQNDFNHLALSVGDESAIFISTEKESWFTQITSFSYIFTFFGLMLLLTLGARQVPSGLSFESVNLTAKIQILLISLTFVTLILFGVGATAFIRNQYEEKTNKIISEKVHSIESEIFQKIGSATELGREEKDYSEKVLENLSKIFITDINIFRVDGDLFASSRPIIYINGLLGEKMNPKAFEALTMDKKSEFIHQERIGKLEYISAYVPFYNNKGKLLAYINLQYFSQQNELENELSEFLVAIINIFVFLLAFSILGAIFVSNWITKPIKMLQNSLKKVELGKRNQRIDYEGSDEIGELVKEYNTKVEELAQNAEKLAQSERESAWREMAKQVAHEIKNPLTPMKLSIQHLQRTFDPNDPNIQDRLKKVASSLIEQIDALSTIASEFSNFAKMPKAKSQTINLISTIENAIELFKDDDNIEINFSNETETSALIYADKELIIRVFNNLIKNAIQAIPKKKKGIINIKVESLNEKQFIVSVQDNGVGIDEKQKEQIFVPNFTTKSTGTGLGLAMVKNIIESAEGEIWFESEKNKGATFYIKFNKQV